MKRSFKRLMKKMDLKRHERKQFDCSAIAQIYKNKDLVVRIDVTPCAAEPTWVTVCRKITERNDDLQETEETNDYCEGEEVDITQVRQDIGITGHTYPDDPAQKFIINAKYEIGTGRKTNVQLIYPWGTRVEGPATLAGIKLFGGAMKEKMGFECMLKMDENPTVYKPEENIELNTFPTPVWDIQPTGTPSTAIFTFANTTEEDKLKQPIEELFADRVKLAVTDGTDLALLPYTLTVENGVYTVTFDAGAWVDFAIEQLGAVSKALKVYEVSTHQYS